MAFGIRSLQASLTDDSNGSKVILTSQLRDVAPQDKLDKESLLFVNSCMISVGIAERKASSWKRIAFKIM